jgi:putative Holliday junction resolvase
VSRALGVDLGTRRIGLAVSDAGGVLASPLTTLEGSRDRQALYRRLADLVAEYEVEVVVVGLPLGLDGGVGTAAAGALAEVEALRDVLAVPVVTQDERFSTVTAHEQLRAAGVDGRRRRKLVDQQAAVVLLQAWLDARRQKDAFR